jgi:hypothetical protein
MSAPGYTVTIGERPASNVPAPTTSAAFMVGFSERGSVTVPTAIYSPADAVNKLGNRLTGEPIAYDSIEAFFREGGSILYFGRINPGAERASKEVVDTESKKDAKFSAKWRGSWGNNIKVAITKTSSIFTFVVKYEGTVVESSPEFSTIAEAIAWAALNSNYVVIATEAESSLIPKTQEVTLSGGTYSTSSPTTEQVETAMNLFGIDLGPGQLLIPGIVTEAVHKAMAAHALANNRRAIMDDTDTAEAVTIAGHASALRTLTGNAQRFCTMVAPWATIPGLSTATVRTIPYSAIYAGQIARSEGEGNSPNQAAAGAKRGVCRWALSLTQNYSAASLETLNNAGVIAAKSVRGFPTTFGNRTLTNPTTDPNWRSFSASRLVMAVAALAAGVLENFEFEQIDGHGYVFKDLQGALSGTACMPFYRANSLYGQTPAEAFQINTGPDVNTTASIAAEEIKAQIALRVSPTGEVLTVEIVKVPTTEGLIA